MQRTYVAYGLQLHSSFELPGMTPMAAGELPSLLLARTTPSALDAAWSGSGGRLEWQGVLGDGCALTIERGLDGDLLFTYADRARFRLDATKVALECAPAEEGLHWQQVLLGRILPNIGLERGYEALHASAVESPEGVIAVAAPSGTGKTTLGTELMRRGWPLFADDVLVLAPGETGVRAHAGTPLMNVAVDQIDHEHSDLGTTLAVLADERWMVATDAADGDRPVRMICLFERGPDLPLRIQRMPASPLPLAPYMLGLPCGSERERERFSLYSDLVGSAELVRLTCDLDDRPAALADLLESTLQSPAVLTAQGAS